MMLARVGDRGLNKTVNVAEIVFFLEVSEIQCVIFQQKKMCKINLVPRNFGAQDRTA